MPRLMNEALDDAAKGRVDTIVAGGGDGTVNEVFSSAFKLGIPAKCTFGILPLGTANDFARSAGLPVDDLTATLLLIANTPASTIDLGLFEGRPFVNMLTGGFGSQVTAETDPVLKRRLGGLAYALTGLSFGSEICRQAQVFFVPRISRGKASLMPWQLETEGKQGAEFSFARTPRSMTACSTR